MISILKYIYLGNCEIATSDVKNFLTTAFNVKVEGISEGLKILLTASSYHNELYHICEYVVETNESLLSCLESSVVLNLRYLQTDVGLF